MTQVPTFLTAAEVARVLRVDAATVRRWANDGLIKSIRLPGGTFRFPAEVVEQITLLPADERISA